MDFRDPFIHLCRHCSKECSGAWCNDCKKSEQRKEMDEENKKLNQDFICKVCDLGWYSSLVQNYNSGVIERIK
jgi:hypothetical protein